MVWKSNLLGPWLRQENTKFLNLNTFNTQNMVAGSGSKIFGSLFQNKRIGQKRYFMSSLGSSWLWANSDRAELDALFLYPVLAPFGPGVEDAHRKNSIQPLTETNLGWGSDSITRSRSVHYLEYRLWERGFDARLMRVPRELQPLTTVSTLLDLVSMV